MFYGSDTHAEAAAAIFSIIASSSRYLSRGQLCRAGHNQAIAGLSASSSDLSRPRVACQYFGTDLLEVLIRIEAMTAALILGIGEIIVGLIIMVLGVTIDAGAAGVIVGSGGTLAIPGGIVIAVDTAVNKDVSHSDSLHGRWLQRRLE